MRGPYETLLLLAVYTGGSTAKALAVALPHFDKHQDAAIGGDQIDFTCLAAQVACQYAKPGLFEHGQRLVFRPAALFLCGRVGAVGGRAPALRRRALYGWAAWAPAALFLAGGQRQPVHMCVIRHHAVTPLSDCNSMNELSDNPGSESTWKHLTERMGDQQWPVSTLYVVATPIGNLGDLSLRAWQALLRCDVIAAEDTRSSRALLDAWGVSTPLVAAHRHNEAEAAQAIVARLAAGERVALVSDAGAPAVSDPGGRIVRVVLEAGYRVMPIPGASAVIAALMGSGVTTDDNPAFVFAGFMPAKAAGRQKWLRQWSTVPAPVVMFESPHRLEAAVRDIAGVCGPDRLITFARELTKRFEQIHTVRAAEAQAWLAEDMHRSQGEFVLIVHQAPPATTAHADASTTTLVDALLESLSVRDAARVAAKVTGLPRDTLYALALSRRKTD